MKNFKIYSNTDTIDIDQKCLGLSVYLPSEPIELRDHIAKNRGLKIQIKHNRDDRTFSEATSLASLIKAAPKMKKVLEYILKEQLDNGASGDSEYIRLIREALEPIE